MRETAEDQRVIPFATCSKHSIMSETHNVYYHVKLEMMLVNIA